jgi:hypothetical protein
MKTSVIAGIMLLFCVASSAQTKLSLSATAPLGCKTGCEAAKAVDGNNKTYYCNEGRGGQQFKLVVNLEKTAKAVKVRVYCSKKGISVYVNDNFYTTTLAADDSFYVIVAEGFSSITLLGDSSGNEYMCYEVTADEYDFNATKLGFSYDKSGNCISRKIVINTSKSATIDTTDIYAENIGNKKITIYPNPTRGNIAVVCEGECGDDGEYRIFDNRGNQLKQDTWIQAGTPISLDDYPLGVYILQLIQNGNAESFTIIKQ